MLALLLQWLCLAVLVLTFSPFAKADSCNDPVRQPVVCREMKHLRSQVLALGAQRDLMKINYDLLTLIGEEVRAGAHRALAGMTTPDEKHGAGLIGVQALGMDLRDQAKQQSVEALVTATKIQKQCSTCHGQSEPTSGYRWEDIFKGDWSVLHERCNEPDRNPYRCRSMYAMFSHYSGFFTAYQVGRQNYELTEKSAKEISRIALDLISHKLAHGLDDLLGMVAKDAMEVEALARDKNPEAFDRARSLTQACMKCHADPKVLSPRRNLPMSPWKN